MKSRKSLPLIKVQLLQTSPLASKLNDLQRSLVPQVSVSDAITAKPVVDLKRSATVTGRCEAVPQRKELVKTKPVITTLSVEELRHDDVSTEKYAIRDDFLGSGSNSQEISSHMKDILVDWMFQIHICYSLLPESMQMAVGLLDRYLQIASVNKNELQLVGVTALFIASKYEQIYSPGIGDFAYITDNTYTNEQIRRTERKMLRDLDFDLGRPLPIHFLRRYCKAANGNIFHHTVAKYLLDLSMIDYRLASVKPSLIAATATHMTRRICFEDTKQGEWNATTLHYTNYTIEDMEPVMRLISRRLLKSYSEENQLMAVVNWYSSIKMLNVGTFDSLKSQIILDWASS